MVDDEIKRANELMRALDSPGMKMARQALEEHQRAMRAIGDPATVRELLDQASRVREYRDLARGAEQVSAMKAMANLASASHAFSESIFGSAAMREMISLAEEQNRIWKEQMDSAVAGIVEYSRTKNEQMSKMVEALGRPAWCDQFASISLAVKGFDLSAFHSRFEPIGRLLAETDAVMRAVRWDRLAALEIAPRLRTTLEFRSEQLIRTCASFTELMVLKPERIVPAPAFVAKMPALAMYSHARALRAIPMPREEEEAQEPQADEELWSGVHEETRTAIDMLLPQVSPELAVSWRGGWSTACKQGDDWVRQSASSLRYVLTSVLDIAAPHDRVKGAGKLDYLDKKGKVTRKGQAAWLCESLRNETYRKVVLADIESALTIINAMSEAVHRSEYQDIEKAFGFMAVRAAVTLRHILELHFQRQ